MQGIVGALAALFIICPLLSPAKAAASFTSPDVLSGFSLTDPGQEDLNQGRGIPATASRLGPDPSSKPVSSTVSPAPLTNGEKFTYYLKSTYGPQSIMFSLAGAGINQARDHVPEWGQGMEGYGKRFASGMGQKAIKRSIQSGLGALLREDPRYFASTSSGIWQRSWYAVGQTFISHKDSGGTRLAYSRFIGIIGGVYLSRRWYPDSERSTGQYIQAGAISLGLDVAKSAFSEFWPSVKRKLFH